MKIQILGTAAAEGWPALFCACDACRKARELGGKNIRTRASIQIDDVWKVDFPPDTMCHVHREKLDLSKLRHLFISHSHMDHMDANDLCMMVPPFGHNGFQEKPLHIYSSGDSIKELQRQVAGSSHGPAAEYHILRAFEPVQAEEISVTPVLANHMPDSECFCYIFERDGARFLYATDTGVFPAVTLEFLEKQHLDLIVAESTIGPRMETDGGHMSMGDVVRLRDRLAGAGAIAADCPVWITHFSHNAKVTHEEFQALASPHGITVAYDGAVIDLV